MPARILIAEDHPSSLELMQYLLRMSGYETLLAKDGVEALEMIRREHPDLVVCDLQMPKVDGYGVLEGLRADPESRNIPIIAVTAFSMVGDRERVLSAGFDGYQSKPIEPEVFVAQMEQHLPAELRGRR
ncbi:MAG: response regulator [Betaproteobacteria bacterium]